MKFLRRLFRDRIAALMADHDTREADHARLTAEQCERLIAAMNERAEQLFPDGGDKFDARQQ